MYNKMRSLHIIKNLLTAGVFLLFAFASLSRADEQNIHQVKDLDYGVSLFHFYQQNYFSAITDLMVGEHYQRLNSGDKNPQLLLGGLYLSYDLKNKSSDVFKELLDDESLNVSLPIKDRAWYLLGKNFYHNALYEDAKSAFLKVQDTLNAKDEEERFYFLSNIYLREKNVVEAKKVLDEFPDDSIWKMYAQFNTASLLIQSEDETDLGHEIFDDLATIETQNPERLILQDKASLALGYVALKNEDSEQAKKYFNNVRIDGTETNKALLGLGWARYREKEYAEAIIPWMSLASKSASDLTVQEALISIPYAFEKMRIDEQALLQYELAIQSYKYQLSETQQLYTFINSPEYLHQLSPGSLGNESTPTDAVIKEIDPLMTRYLLPLLTSSDFQEAISTYQQVNHLKYRLDHWVNGVPALRMILKEKRKTYKNKLSETMDPSNFNRVASLLKSRDRLAAELKQINNKQAALKFASEDELEKLKLINDNGRRIKALKGSSEEISEQRNKHRLIKGLMLWELKTEYPVRLWAAQKELNQLDKAVADMKKSMVSLKSSWSAAPSDFSQFDRRIANKEKQIQGLNNKVSQAISRQEKHLRTMGLHALKLHRNQLKLYHDRALFAKARLYDSLMANE